MIPPEKSAAVTQALREAFGVTGFDDIVRLTKGHTTSLVFRIVVRGSPYLLKVIMRTDDATRHFACMRAAADAGLAPRVWYTSIEDRVAITDFVEEVPLPPGEAPARMATVLRTLHALPPFPDVPGHLNTTCMFLMNEGSAVEGFLQKFRAANILPEGETAELLARRTQLAEIYSRHEPDMVSSHNDLFKPDNILFDGQRVCLVDWEAAFRNDRYADLAVVANLLVTNDAEELAFLQAYFGQAPDPCQQARFFLMQQLSHLFYAMVFLLFGSGGQPVNLREDPPDVAGFQWRFRAGEIDLADKQMKLAYGRFHWEQLSRNWRNGRFEEAVSVVSERFRAGQPAYQAQRESV